MFITRITSNTMHLHLGFRPSSLSLDVGGRSYRLPAAATAVWRVRAAGGVAMLSARARGNGASYVARFIIRPAR
jgi:hypothetical protein